MGLLELALAAHEGIEVEEVGDGEPLVEPEDARVMGVGGKNGSAGPTEAIDVPFAKVAGGVAGFFKSGGEGLFLTAESVTVVEDGGAVVGSSGENAGARGGAVGSGVKVVEAETVCRHGVEVGCF